ncbi:AAA domain-containing protein [Roseimicrobium gellanilyticum]|uniref:AAA domain-containing protein n=2 Tax=Roseimicrobium gellanilyticum TaxID=748857 RepID=A0A366H498_9BACT|nr:AAA domain-containing protein [Roseimicrobium gellanilyticum]
MGSFEETGGTVLADLPAIVSYQESLRKQLEPPKVIVEGLIHKGTKASFVGGSKSYKTWCLLHLAACVASGRPWLGRCVEPGRVLFVNFELAEVFVNQRVAEILKASEIPEPEELHFLHLRGHACGGEKILPKISALTKERGFDLMVIDPTYKLLGGRDENAAGEISELLNQFEKICVETGAAVVFGAHFSKGNQAARDVLDRVSGSGVFARDPDTILTLTPHEAPGSFVLESTLRNFAPADPFVVKWEPPIMKLAEDLDPKRLRSRRGSQLTKPTMEEYLALFPPGGLSATELVDALASKGWAKKFEKPLREAAINSGKLVVETGAHNRKTIKRTRPDITQPSV